MARNACHKIWFLGRLFLREEDGPTATEYAVMLGIIVVAAITGFSTFADGVGGLYVVLADAMDSAL